MQAKSEHYDILDYDWEDFDVHIGNVMSFLDISKFKTIVGVAKGGLVLAVKLSNATNIPMKTITAKSYTDKAYIGLMVEDYDCSSWEGPILLVDDIVDRGLTMARLSTELKVKGKEVTTLALCFKPHSAFKPDYYQLQVENHMWVNFPWE